MVGGLFAVRLAGSVRAWRFFIFIHSITFIMAKRNSKENIYKTLYVLTEYTGMSRSAAYKIVKPNTEAKGESLSVMASRFMGTEEYKICATEMEEKLKERFKSLNLDLSNIGELSKDDAVQLLSASLKIESDPKKKAEIIMLLSRLKGWDKIQESETETARPVLYIPFKAFGRAIGEAFTIHGIETDRAAFLETFKGLFHTFKTLQDKERKQAADKAKAKEAK